jgi:hypothetical protein
MTCFLSNGAIFHHIPKTGGTWVFSALQALNLVSRPCGHVHADYFHTAWHEILYPPRGWFAGVGRSFKPARSPAFTASTFRFCFVREPLAWYESYWRYMQDQGWPHWGTEGEPSQWHPCAPLNGLQSDEFNTFVGRVNAKRPGFVSEMFSLYTDASISFVGKQESLVEDFMKAMGLMNLYCSPAFLEKRKKENLSLFSAAKVKWNHNLVKKTAYLESAAYERYSYCQEEAVQRALSG